jgi:hypothetical protein
MLIQACPDSLLLYIFFRSRIEKLCQRIDVPVNGLQLNNDNSVFASNYPHQHKEADKHGQFTARSFIVDTGAQALQPTVWAVPFSYTIISNSKNKAGSKNVTRRNSALIQI